MALSSMKAMHKTQATRKFTDREEARDSFYRLFNSYLSNSLNLSVLVYYGIGGIGKTSLLDELLQSAQLVKKNNNLTIVNINLESSHLNNTATCLFAVYKQLKIQSFSFEYALAKLWSLQGWSVKDIKSRNFSSDSFLYDIVEAGIDSADAFMPIRLFHKLVESGHELAIKYSKNHRQQLEEINSLNESSLESRLPFYLGQSIEHEAEINGRKFLFFFDTHESIIANDNFKNTKRSGDWWLQELIGCSEKGLYVIAGREYLKWGDQNPEWNKFLEQHILGSLSDKDADYFLSQIPIKEEDIRSQIIETAHGMPLYLDLCATAYLIRKNENCEVSADDFKKSGDEVIARFISHLELEQAEALKASALLEVFDQELFLALVKGLNINFPTTLFEEFCSTSYTESIPSMKEGYKIHSMVREFIYKNVDNKNVLQVINVVLDHCSKKLDLTEMNRTLWVFSQALHIISKLQVNINERQSNRIMQIGLSLIESGYWKDLTSAITTNFDFPFIPNTPFSVKFLMAVSLRKQGELSDAIKLYKEVLESQIIPNSWRPLIEYYYAHSIHLTGRYSEALSLYKQVEIDSKYDTSDMAMQATRLAQRQIADLYMLKGQFQDALENFSHLLNTDEGIIWRLELLRFKGHVYRFNFMLEQAEDIYRQALKLSESHNAEAMKAKILTNLAETLCWNNPREAIEFADKAIKLNDTINAPIEVGKAQAAKSLALSNLNKYKEALTYAENAISMQRNNGYLSGEVFGLQAKAIAEYKLKNLVDFEASYKAMQKLISEIDLSYEFLLTPLVYLYKNKDEFTKFKNKFNWLEGNEINNLLDLLNND